MKAMNTREEIIAFLSKSKKPLKAKEIAFELKKTSANIRKILSNLCREKKIERAGYDKYISSVNVSGKSVNVEAPGVKKLIYKEIYKYRKKYFERLKIDNPEAYERIKKARCEYLKRWREKNPDYNKIWLRAYYKKYPEKFREYTKRYWLKKALNLKPSQPALKI